MNMDELKEIPRVELTKDEATIVRMALQDWIKQYAEVTAMLPGSPSSLMQDAQSALAKLERADKVVCDPWPHWKD